MNRHFTTSNTARVSTTEAAKYLGVSIATIRRWTDSGKLKCGRTPGNQRRFSIEELDRIAAEMAGDA